MEEKFLRYGDIVLFYSEQHNGYFQSSGFIDNRTFIQSMSHENAEIFTENQRQFLFRVMPRLSYESIKEYQKQLKIIKIRNRSSFSKTRKNSSVDYQNILNVKTLSKIQSEMLKEEERTLQQNKQRAQAEKEMNQKSIESFYGQNVLYGADVQFQHVISDYFLTATNEVADVDKTCYKVKLQEEANSSFVFRIKPRYKYRNEGDKIMFADQLVIQSIKNSMNLNIGETPLPLENDIIEALDRVTNPSLFVRRYEVNLAIAPCSIQLVSFGSSDKESQY